MITTAETALAIIGIFSCGSLIIEARTHHLINKAMHRNVAAMFANNLCDCKQSNYDNQENKNTHGAPHLMP